MSGIEGFDPGLCVSVSFLEVWTLYITRLFLVDEFSY